MKRRLFVFIIVLALVVGSGMAAETTLSAGVDYGATLLSNDFFGTQFIGDSFAYNFIGFNTSVSFFANEFSANGFFTNFALQTWKSIKIVQSNGLSITQEVDSDGPFAGYLMNILAGHTYRFALAEALDLSIGLGGTYQLFILDASLYSSLIPFFGAGANAQLSYFLISSISLNVGLDGYFGLYDIKAKEFVEQRPITLRPYISAGFRF